MKRDKPRTHKWLHLGLALVVLGTGTVLIWVVVQPNHAITGHGFSQIHRGMTEEEVEAALGVPPGNYTGEHVTTLYQNGENDFIAGWELRKVEGGKEWIGNHMSIYVRYDEHGRVADARSGTVSFVFSNSLMARWIRWFIR